MGPQCRSNVCAAVQCRTVRAKAGGKRARSALASFPSVRKKVRLPQRFQAHRRAHQATCRDAPERESPPHIDVTNGVQSLGASFGSAKVVMVLQSALSMSLVQALTWAGA